MEQLIYANCVTKIRNVVFMGMGEPLNNFENVKKAVEFMIDSKRFGLGKLICMLTPPSMLFISILQTFSPYFFYLSAGRHVTVSTVGVLKNMYRLCDELPQVNLALSLHAPNQEV
ncbi:hypothetical protein EON65_24550 [archaeon]|nr:MAG: hypothetical protein EON65_24550 [archaeon]